MNAIINGDAMTSLACRFVKETAGAAMAEFALVAAVFLPIILFGIAEIGLAAWSKNSVASDAREGARFAVVRGSASPTPATAADVKAFVLSKTSLSSDSVVTIWPSGKGPGSLVSVHRYNVRPRRGLFLPATTDSSTSTMVIVF
jgi:Flp pilus assembly pilin Flp